MSSHESHESHESHFTRPGLQALSGHDNHTRDAGSLHVAPKEQEDAEEEEDKAAELKARGGQPEEKAQYGGILGHFLHPGQGREEKQ